MSLKSWKKEFYCMEANQTTEATALDHSIRKWTGLLPQNLQKHFMKKNGRFIVDNTDNKLEIDNFSCALCFHYDKEVGHECKNCPLYQIRGNNRCDSRNFDIENEQPYYYWKFLDDPTIMLGWLYLCKNFKKVL